MTANLTYTDTVVDVPIFHLHGSPYSPCSSRSEPDTINKLRNKVPHHLREAYDAAPVAMLRLLDSWIYVNDESVTDLSNTTISARLETERPLIAQNHRFKRDVEDELWD